MTATVLEPTIVETTEDENLGHIICHCSDLNIAWCGQNVTGHVLEAANLDLDEACPLCVLCASLRMR